MKKVPKVSFLLLNWNGIGFTRKCLRSLLKTSYQNFEIIVVDNGSENDEATILEKEFAHKIKVIKNKVNVGYAAGMNVAIKNSIGEYLMILNNDMEFEKNWLQPLVTMLQSNKMIAACQPKIKDLKAKGNFEYAAAAGGYIDILGYTFARGRIFSAVEKDTGQYDQPVRVSWAGVILVKRSVLKRTGLFDPLYFAYAEDVDLCYRIYGQGYQIVYVPESVVYHYGGGVMGKNMPRKMFFIHRNHLILILKNWELQTLLLLVIPRVMLDGVSFVYYFVTGYRDISYAVVRSYLSLFTMIPAIIKSRKNAQKIIKKENRSLLPLYKGSIVWEYFIRRKKIFTEIMNSEDYKVNL